MPEAGISPCDCKHRRRQFVSSGWCTGIEESSRYAVTLCLECGEFAIFTENNNQAMTVRFALVGEEAVEAAGKWNRYLNSEQAGE